MLMLRIEHPGIRFIYYLGKLIVYNILYLRRKFEKLKYNSVIEYSQQLEF